MDAPAKLRYIVTYIPQTGFTPAFNISHTSQAEVMHDVNVAHILNLIIESKQVFTHSPRYHWTSMFPCIQRYQTSLPFSN